MKLDTTCNMEVPDDTPCVTNDNGEEYYFYFSGRKGRFLQDKIQISIASDEGAQAALAVKKYVMRKPKSLVSAGS